MMNQFSMSVRSIQPSDTSFIMNSWLKSYRYDSYFTKRITDTIFYKYHHVICTRILERPTTQVLVACDPEDSNVIYGYLVYEKDANSSKYVVHYGYVKGPFRTLGIVSTLLKASELDLNESYVSHWTTATDWIIKKFPNLTYVPYLI